MTHFKIVEPRKAEQLYVRITAPERSEILASNLDRLEYIRQTDFASDGPPTIEEMLRLQDMLNKDYAK